MKRLFVLGDSISIHYGPHLCNLLRDRVEYSRKGGINPGEADIETPAAANGGDSQMMLTFLEEISLKGFHTELLLLNCGLHDIKRTPFNESNQQPPDRYNINLKAIRTLALTLADHVIWVRTTLLEDQTHAARCKNFVRLRRDAIKYNHIADNIMRGSRISSIDLSGFTEALDGDLYCDHVHFHDPIRRLQAAFIAGHLWQLT